MLLNIKINKKYTPRSSSIINIYRNKYYFICDKLIELKLYL